MSKFKIGQLVNVNFKPTYLNPYIIMGVGDSKYGKYDYPPTTYSIGRYNEISFFEVNEDEIELHISEIRDSKLEQLGIK